MLTRIRLRRTASSLNSLSNNANENHHLRYGEALYSFADHMMVVGPEIDQVISNIPNRIIAFPKVARNLIFSGPTSGNNAFPTFRRLDSSDMPDTYKNKGSATQPVYFNASGVPTTISYTIAKSVPSNAVFTDRYVNSIAFADDTTANANKPIKLTLTRAGSDTTAIVGNIPKVSASSAGVVPKGVAVSSQTQNTKFLREDGTWAKPSYTSNTNTTYTFANGTDGSFTVTPSGGSAQKVTIGKPATAGTADSATKLSTGKTLKVNLASTNASTAFNGTANITDIGVAGVLPIANGGTGKSSWTANQLVYASAASTLGQLVPSQANYVLMSNSSKQPEWSDPSNLINTSLDNSYVWDTVTYDKRYAGSDGNLNSSSYIDLEKNLGALSAGFVSLSPLANPVNSGTDWSNYRTSLQSLNYAITIYENCTKSYSGGNLICTLTGVAASKTFPYTALSGAIGTTNVRPCNSYINDSDALVYTSPDRNCYIVAGIHGENYQITNPGIPITFRTGAYDGEEATNWILHFKDHSTGSGHANLPTLKCYAFQCLLSASNGYRPMSALQVACGGRTWGYVSDYDVDVSFSYYVMKNPQINYISSNWAVTTGAYNAKTHGMTTSGNAKIFNLRRGSFASRLSGKILLGSRVGNDASSFRISFSETKSGSTIYIIPRLIVYGNSRNVLVISTVNLDATTLEPVVNTYQYSTAIATVKWYPVISNASSTCTGLTITLSTSSATSFIDQYNKAGESYTFYGYA